MRQASRSGSNVLELSIISERIRQQETLIQETQLLITENINTDSSTEDLSGVQNQSEKLVYNDSLKYSSAEHMVCSFLITTCLCP
jgi:hypothetical protein